jgi:SLT domain-containing protein
VSKESGGNPRAENPTAVLGQHASGFWQMLPSTFAAYSRGGSIWDPIAEGVAAIGYIKANYGTPFNIPGLLSGSYGGYASGTLSAQPGWAWVGERGPELMRFRGGEQVIPAGAPIGNTYVTVNVPAAANPAEVGRHIATALAEFKKRGGWVYKPAGF